MKKYQIVMVCMWTVGFLSGCSTRESVQIPQTFFSQPNSVVITQLSGLEEPGYYRKGKQGLVDFAISDVMTNSLQEKIREINTSDILN